MTLPQETIDKMKADAENYAGVMVWINKQPKGEEQLFHEYISATSHIAGATEWAERVQPVVQALEKIAGFEIPRNHSERKSYIAYTKSLAFNALAKYKEASNG